MFWAPNVLALCWVKLCCSIEMCLNIKQQRASLGSEHFFLVLWDRNFKGGIQQYFESSADKENQFFGPKIKMFLCLTCSFYGLYVKYRIRFILHLTDFIERLMSKQYCWVTCTEVIVERKKKGETKSLPFYHFYIFLRACMWVCSTRWQSCQFIFLASFPAF